MRFHSHLTAAGDGVSCPAVVPGAVDTAAQATSARRFAVASLGDAGSR